MKEYYEGGHAKSKSIAAIGNEKLKYLSLAVTAYCKAQAHFRQLINLLNPPATSPENLGLKPWEFWKEKTNYKLDFKLHKLK